MITLKAAHAKDFLDKESEYLALAQLLLLNQNPYWAAEVLISGQNKITTRTETVVDKVTKKETKVEKTGPVVRNTEKNLKLLADSWRMAQEIDKAIPVLEKAAKRQSEHHQHRKKQQQECFEQSAEQFKMKLIKLEANNTIWKAWKNRTVRIMTNNQSNIIH